MEQCQMLLILSLLLCVLGNLEEILTHRVYR